MSFLRQLSESPIRLPRLRSRAADPNAPTIFSFNANRDAIIDEVARRVVDEALSGGREELERMLNDAALAETRRLSSQKDGEARDNLSRWRNLLRRIGSMSERELEDELRRTAKKMGHDIAGNFDPRVYDIASGVVPKLITAIMRPTRLPKELFVPGTTAAVRDLVQVEGDVELLRTLEKKGTLIYTPTHSSNLDSVVLGQALLMSGLAPAMYGAGKNLFTNPVLSFFMHNLGAYRVDRRVRALLYKKVLKMYSQVAIERGYHSLFFPGGTRSRSGMIEHQLKLGLAGSAISAFARNSATGIRRPVFFVPTTINYALVLEAESLTNDWLKEEGRARFVYENDESSQVERWISFLRKIVDLKTACVIRFGRPIDPFGNPVDLPMAKVVAPTARRSIRCRMCLVMASRRRIRIGSVHIPRIWLRSCVTSFKKKRLS